MSVEREFVTVVPAPIDRVFDLALNVETHVRSMAASRERAIAGVTSGQLGLGDEVTWLAWHFGAPWRMTSRITALQRPTWFVDEQVRGPFRSFRHEHRFSTEGAATVMRDLVRFTAPGGIAGRLAERCLLDTYLHRLIEQRNDTLKTLAAGTGADRGGEGPSMDS